MSLSDQIKQPGQIIGAGGGGGGSTDASDLTTGTLAAARLPGVLANVDTQAELLSAAAAAAASHTHAASDIASGTVATARLGSGTANSTTFLRGDQTWATPSDATKLPLAGGTLTGDLLLSGAVVRGAAANDTVIDAQSGRVVAVRINGTTYVDFRNNSTLATTRFFDSSGANACDIISSSGILYVNGPSGVVLRFNGSDKATTNTSGLIFPNGTNLQVANGHYCNLTHNAVTQARWGPSGLELLTATQYGPSSTWTIRPQSDTAAVHLYGSLNNNTGFSMFGASNATYPGHNSLTAPLSTRTASAAIGLCAVPTGDMAEVTIFENTIDSCKAFVNAAGTVTLTSLSGGTVNANIVNSSSPTASQYGVYVSAGVLYFKGGSSYAGKMASFSMIGKA